jgi:hypothetical protein
MIEACLAEVRIFYVEVSPNLVWTLKRNKVAFEHSSISEKSKQSFSNT